MDQTKTDAAECNLSGSAKEPVVKNAESCLKRFSGPPAVCVETAAGMQTRTIYTYK